MSRAWLAAALSAGLVLTAAGCGSGSDETAGPSEATLARGSEVYAANCASCHGANLEGTDRGPSHLSVVYEPGHHPDAAFRAAIENGAMQHHWPFGPMPPVEGLSDTDVDAVIAFIRSEQERQGLQR